MGSVKEHVIIQGLGRIDPGSTNHWPKPTITGIRSLELKSAEVWETCDNTPSLFESPPERGDAMVFPTKPKMEDWPTGQDASPIEAATQPASTPTSMVELTSSIVPPDQMEEERQ